MKILHVIDRMELRMGGVGQAILNMVNGLKEHGIDNEVACLDKEEILGTGGFPSLVNFLGPGIRPWAYSARLMPWLKVNLYRFDVIILHGLWLYPGYALHRALIRLKARQYDVNRNARLPRFFVMPHGMLDPYFQHAAGRKLKAIRNRLYWKLIEHRVVNNADGLLFTCEEELRLARLSFHPYSPRQELCVGLGVIENPGFETTMQAAFHQKCPFMDAGPYLLFLGRITEKKGVEMLISAYAAMLIERSGLWASPSRALVDFKEGRQVPVPTPGLPRLVIAGPGLETAYGRRMQQLVNESALLREAIFFPGLLAGEAKWGALYGCDAFILPSHQENFGIAVVEALACGKPVLISNQVNTWREIELAGAGLVAADNLAATIDILKRWFQMPVEQKETMARNARLVYQNRFAMSATIKRLVDTLNPSA